MNEQLENASAAATMRRAGARAGASAADVDQVIAVLFAPTISLTPLETSKANAGVPLSPADKHRIRVLLSEGRDTMAIAEEVGCSRQAVSGVRVHWKAAQR